MPKTFTVEVPNWIDDDKEAIADYVASIQDEYLDALDQTANPHDERSAVDDISINSVKVSDEYVEICYTVEYSAYHGCRDANYADSDERDIVATRNGRVLTFETFEYHAPLAPNEEL